MRYLIAGEVIEAISGQSWEDFVSSRILAKVGMTGSNVRHSASVAGGNVATTHARIDGKVRPIARSPDTDFSFDFHDLLLKPVSRP